MMTVLCDKLLHELSGNRCGLARGHNGACRGAAMTPISQPCPKCGSNHHDQPNPRSDAAMALLRAFNNAPADWTPPPSWGCYPNDWCSAAWERVMGAARVIVMKEVQP